MIELLRCVPVCIVAKTPHALNTHESINPEQKQQRRIGIDVKKGSTLRDHGRWDLNLGSLLESFSPVSSRASFVSVVRSSICTCYCDMRGKHGAQIKFGHR
jgi:hypothetical protein